MCFHFRLTLATVRLCERITKFARSRFLRRTENERDIHRGLDFDSIIQPEEVGLNSDVAFRSSPSGNDFLRRVLDDFNITKSDCIVDIGCGKGSAMRTMLEYPFAKVDGIELSAHIASIARTNFKRLNAKRCTVFVGDAAAFRDLDVYNFVYFYNPFPATVMSKVIDNLIASIRTHPRKLSIIYNNATCHDIVIRCGLFSQVAEYPDEWGNGISVFVSNNVEL